MAGAKYFLNRFNSMLDRNFLQVRPKKSIQTRKQLPTNNDYMSANRNVKIYLRGDFYWIQDWGPNHNQIANARGFRIALTTKGMP